MSGRITPPSAPPDGSGYRFAIVAARFHDDVTSRLVEGALDCFAKHGATDVTVDWVPGSFELPLAARAVATRQTDEPHGIVALGCVIRGDTPHFHFVSDQTASGLMALMLEIDRPVAFGVLTTDTHEQAMARAGGSEGNKGWDAALGTMEMVQLLAAQWG